MRIKKTSETRPLAARVLNVNSGSQTDAYSCNYVNNVLKGTTLYNGPASDQTITLSDSAANYDFLEVYYYGSNGGSTWEMKKIDSPNQKWLGLNYTAHNSGGTFWFYSTRVYIENNKITPSYAGRVYIAGNTVAGQTDTNYISIYKVIGYKY